MISTKGRVLQASTFSQLFCCPVCGRALVQDGDARTFGCAAGHSFDVAREGYLNLLLAQRRHSRNPGYSREMIAARRDFFDAGFYEPLADSIAEVIVELAGEVAGAPTVFDAGCGEGYYLRRLRQSLERAGRGDAVLGGLDISKPAVQIAGKRDPLGAYAVAGTFEMPVLPQSVDILLTHFSPVSAEDFLRVLRPGGLALVGGPGPQHLQSIKNRLYDNPVEHEPTAALAGVEGFEPLPSRVIRYSRTVVGSQHIRALLTMTPYNWSSSESARAAITELPSLDLDIDVVLEVYRRRPDEISAGQ